jgi:hypothetical protein
VTVTNTPALSSRRAPAGNLAVVTGAGIVLVVDML